MLPINRGGTTVDVGAGGNLSLGNVYTTDPVLEVLGGRIICIQPDENDCLALKEKYGAKIALVQGYYGTVGVGEPSDLVIIDVDTSLTNVALERLIYFAIEDGLKIGGFIVVSFIYDVGRAYPESGEVINPAGREQQATFMKRFFGAEALTAEIIAKKFENDANFRFIGFGPRELEGRNNGVGLLVLRRVA
jgi:hypothetical protein